MAWCLLPEAVENFKRGLKSGDISPEKLNEMTTQERTSFLERYVGDQAPDVNKRFEKSLLLKRRDEAMLKWARETSGVYGARRTALIEKVKERMQQREGRIFNPKEEETFLSSLAEQKIGMEITREEAKGVFELSRKVDQAKSKFDPQTNTWAEEKDRFEYGAAKVMLDKYVTYLKDEFRGSSSIERVKGHLNTAGVQIKNQPLFGTLNTIASAIKELSQLSVSMVASLDNSFIGRQGLNTLFSHPTAWGPAALKSFTDFGKTIANKKFDALDVLHTDIASRPNAMNGNYKKAGILDPNEEQFPTSIPEKIPLFGRVFKGSEVAFKGSAMRMRADLFDLLLGGKESAGIDITDRKEIESTGRIVGSLTAKGDIGRARGLAETLLWAPKMLKANFDVLTAHTLDYATGRITLGDYKEAWSNLFKIAAMTAALLAVAKAVDPNSIETDPTSPDFGKIKLGHTRIDITGGKAGLITLAARLAFGYSKSSATGEINPYGTKIGQQTRWDALLNFFSNKVTPPLAVIIDLMKGTDATGQPVTLGGELTKVSTPISAQNIIEALTNPPDANRAAGVVADFVGLSSNTYEDSNIKSGIIPEGKKISNKDFISQVVTYAKAIGTDPETAFNRIFTGQKIRRVDNGAIIVERMSLDDSTAVKKKGNGNNPSMKLDHTIPLQLGGSNDESNLKLVTTSEWRKYTPVENHLGELLRDGKISKKEAQDLIVRFKQGKVKADDILKR